MTNVLLLSLPVMGVFKNCISLKSEKTLKIFHSTKQLILAGIPEVFIQNHQ